MKSPSLRKHPTIGVCGLDCGLCPRYYTRGKSRCPGCGGPGFFSKHPSCSFITCCVRQKNLETCAHCSDFPCPKFKTDEEYQHLEESSSYPSGKVLMRNLESIRREGMKRFMDQQRRRIKLLERMIDGFDDGRSRSCFCRAACLHELETLDRAWRDANRKINMEGIKPNDRKGKAKILKEILRQDVCTFQGQTARA